MINFSEDVVFNLTKIDDSKINKNISLMLVEDEKVVGVYKTVRDQVVFTNKRIVAVDVQGITGKRQEIYTIPYANIQYFSVQTVGFLELVPDSELDLYFTNGFKAHFEFRGKCDILQIGKDISRYALK